jgi:hypothetical protein
MSAEPYDWATVACWLFPEETAMVAASPAVLVRENDAGVPTPVVEAVTVYEPAESPAVAVTVAMPAALVSAGDPVKAADAPEPGAVNVTGAFATGFPCASVTRTERDDAKASPTVALCPPPPFAVMEAAAPAVFVNEKDAGVATPDTLAVTV